jgi:hypothetical protein
MPSNSDRSLGMKTAFTATFSTSVVEILSFVMEEGVGDDLLEGRIFFSFASVHKKIIGRVKKSFQIPVDIALDALE